MKYTLKCRFCNKKVGELDLPEGKSFNQEMFADIRCSDCEVKYGVYSNIIIEAEKKLRSIVDNENLQVKIKEFLEQGEYKKQNVISKVDNYVEQELAKKEEEVKEK